MTRPFRRFLFIFFLLLIGLTVIVFSHGAGEPDARIVFRTSFSGGDIPGVDPALTENPYSIQLVESMTVGLLRMNEETLALEAGMAERYEFNESRDEITFHLRSDVRWVRYDPESETVEIVRDCAGTDRFITAEDFRYGVERVLNPGTGSAYAFLLNKIISGATAYNDGSARDFSSVGVEAPDSRTLVVRLREPSPYALNILSLWVVRAMPKWLIEGDACGEGYGDRWTEAGIFQGYGPFTLKSWTHDAELTLIRNPFWPGSEAVPAAAIDEIETRMMSETSALAEYEAGRLDSAIVPFSDFDRIADDPSYADQIIEKPLNIGTEGMIFNHLLPPTDDPRVRRALALAVDRPAIVHALKSGTPARFWIHPGVSGAPGTEMIGEYGARANLDEARALIADYCAEKGLTPNQVKLSYYYSAGDLHQIRAEVVTEYWRKELGINVVLENSDWGVFKDVRKEGLHNVYRTAWIQDYFDANNFTADVFLCPGGYYQASTDWPTLDCADSDDADALYSEYAALVSEAALESDPIRRAELYARSESIITNEAAILVPISYNDATYLINPRFTVRVSRSGYDRWEKWGVAETAEAGAGTAMKP